MNKRKMESIVRSLDQTEKQLTHGSLKQISKYCVLSFDVLNHLTHKINTQEKEIEEMKNKLSLYEKEFKKIRLDISWLVKHKASNARYR